MLKRNVLFLDSDSPGNSFRCCFLSHTVKYRCNTLLSEIGLLFHYLFMLVGKLSHKGTVVAWRIVKCHNWKNLLESWGQLGKYGVVKFSYNTSWFECRTRTLLCQCLWTSLFLLLVVFPPQKVTEPLDRRCQGQSAALWTEHWLLSGKQFKIDLIVLQ